MDGSREEYEVAVMKDVMIPMRDGVRLAADIYRPVRDGKLVETPLPVLLERTPYNKADPLRVQRNAEYFVRRGYVSAIQDVRGRFRSEGDFYFLAGEAADGHDTVEWIGKQPWCDGNVATQGTSYMAWVQSSLATLGPPSLAAMCVNQGGSNAHTSSVRHGGAFEMRFLCWAFRFGALSKEALEDPVIGEAIGRVNLREWLTRTPFRRGCSPLQFIPAYERWAFDILTHGDYDDFWKQRGFNIEEHWDEHADVPVYLFGAWYDSYTRSTLDNYIGLSHKKKGPIKVIMGPWTHGWEPLGFTYAGDVDFGPSAAIDYGAHRLRWFDQWLKGMETGVADEPPVHLFVMGGGSGRRNPEGRFDHGGRWRFEREWPLARTSYKTYYLRGDGSLSLDKPDREDAPSCYLYYPSNPVPTIGGNMSSLAGLLPRPEGAPPIRLEQREQDIIGIAGAFDQREHPMFFGCEPPYLPLASRHDVLVFRTRRLERDVEVTGPITVTLFASSSAVDTDFTAKLIDEYPPNADYPEGYAMNLTDSIIRARYRNSRDRAELLAPGEVAELTIVLYPTANVFQEGHRIRLDISSSNYPRFDINPNTGEPLWLSRKRVVAENTIYHDAEHPSHIVLPVIP